MNQDQPFGNSLALEDGDIVFANNTLQMVSGTDNLLQSLELRVLTPFGSDIFNTTYGLDVTQAFTQPGSIRMVKELLKLSLVQTLGTDPRVQDILDVQFSEVQVGDLQHSRSWTVNVVIHTVDAQTTTLTLNIGV